MSDKFDTCFSLLVNLVSAVDGVLAIGKSGGERFPEKDESDIDFQEATSSFITGC